MNVHVRIAGFAPIAFALLACSKPTPTSADAGAPAIPSLASSSSSSRPAARAAHPAEAELAAVAKRWNDALAKRDAQALASVYGARVQLYDKRVDRDLAIKTKAAALASARDYTQSITALEIDLRDGARPKAVFDKKWTANAKLQSVRGSLVFAKEGGQWVVVEESDAKTDERRARAATKDSCEALVIAVVASTPEAARLLNGPTNSAAGHASNGMRIGGGPPESAKYGVAVHENHEDRLVTLAWFDVDPKTGVVTDTIDDAPQKADPALVEKLKAACAK